MTQDGKLWRNNSAHSLEVVIELSGLFSAHTHTHTLGHLTLPSSHLLLILMARPTSPLWSLIALFQTGRAWLRARLESKCRHIVWLIDSPRCFALSFQRSVATEEHLVPTCNKNHSRVFKFRETEKAGLVRGWVAGSEKGMLVEPQSWCGEVKELRR